MSEAIPVGVDIAKKKFDAARLQDGKYRHKVFPNTPEGFAAFLAWLAGFGPMPVRVVMEATGVYSVPLAEFLVDQGLWVSVVNPAQIKAFAKSELCRAKTDRADAKLIARFARERQPPRWNPPPPALRELQALLRRVEQLLEMRQMERNRLDTANPAAHASLQTLIATLDQELATLRATIRHMIDDDPDLRGRRDLLASIPGLGDATIAHLLVLFSPHYGFHSAKQVVAFVGLAPNPHQSGDTEQTRLSKIGDALLRKVLYMPALAAWKHNLSIRVFCERLKANGKSGKAVVCAAMRKLLHIAFGVLKSGQPFDPNLALAK
jgi:transposase